MFLVERNDSALSYSSPLVGLGVISKRRPPRRRIQKEHTEASPAFCTARAYAHVLAKWVGTNAMFHRSVVFINCSQTCPAGSVLYNASV